MSAANQGKLAALDALWEAHQVLCQQDVTYFCTVAAPDPHLDFVFSSPLSARWQRVAVQQAAGMAHSWYTKRSAAQADYADRLAYYQSLSADQQATRKQPAWKEWQTPILKAVCIQANANVLLRVTDEYAALALEDVPRPTVQDVSRGTTGVDIGIRHYLTDSRGQHDGGVDDHFTVKLQRVSAKTSRKAKRSAC